MTEFMVNRPDDVYVEQKRRIEKVRGQRGGYLPPRYAYRW
jgi:hypothetical protein